MTFSEDIQQSKLYGLVLRLQNNSLLTPGESSVVKPHQRVVYFFLLFAWLGFLFETILFPVLYHRMKVWQGPLHGPWLVIYGFGGVAMLVALGNFKSLKLMVGKLNITPVLVTLIMLGLVSVVEFVGHLLLQQLFGWVLWDYSSEPFNLQGRICLFNSLGFAILGTLVLYSIVPVFEWFLRSLSNRQNTVLFGILFCSFGVDCLISFSLVLLGMY